MSYNTALNKTRVVSIFLLKGDMNKYEAVTILEPNTEEAKIEEIIKFIVVKMDE